MSKPLRYAFLAACAVVGAIVGYLAANGALGVNPFLLFALMILVIGVVIYFGLRGNKSVGTLDPAARTRALDGIPPGAARLIVVREGFIGKLSGIDVLIDGQPRTQLKSPRFAVVFLKPGTHSITAKVAMKPKPVGPLDIGIAEGETAVVRIVVELGDTKLERDTWDPGLRARLDQIPMVAG